VEAHLNDRRVEIIDVEVVDGVARIVEAYYYDTSEDLTEEEISVLEDAYQDSLIEHYAEELFDDPDETFNSFYDNSAYAE
jgi:hypothetical protein